MKLGAFAIAGLVVSGLGNNAYAQNGGMGGMGGMGHSCAEDDVAEPLLSVADVDGSGRVGFRDLMIVARHAHRHDYVALYDLNADLRLDYLDFMWALFDFRQYSSAFDQELVTVYRATRRYTDVNNALADGYRPFTQELAGHGQHYARMPFVVQLDGSLDPGYENILDETIDIAMPEGLNYDQDGNLVAVFYFHGINVLNWVLASRAGDQAALGAMFQQSLAMSLPGAVMPTSTSSDQEMWHRHFGPCWDNLDYPRMSFDATHTPYFTQPLTQRECGLLAAQSQGTATPKVGWLPAFNMMHIWVHKLNRCGVFAGTDPEVSPEAPVEPHVQTFEEWMAKLSSGQ